MQKGRAIHDDRYWPSPKRINTNMLKRILLFTIHHFQKPIHFYRRPWFLVGLNIILSALIMIFYEPFGYHFDSWAECTQLIGFSVIAFFSSVLFFLCIPQEPHMQKWMTHWTIGKNCVYSFLFLLCTGICISFYDFHLIMQYRSIDYGTRAFYVCLLTDTIGTITIGIVPLCIGLLLEHTHRLKQDLKKMRILQNQQAIQTQDESNANNFSKEEIVATVGTIPNQTAPGSTETSILLTGDTKDSLEVIPSQIIYLEASGNYVNVYYRQEKQTRKILRTTFRNMEEQLIHYPFLVRCHRTYMVNVHFIQAIDRNEQGYHVHLKDGATDIPVSRTYLQDLRNVLNE